MRKFLVLLLAMAMLFLVGCGDGNNTSVSDGIDVSNYQRMSLEKQAGKDYKILQLTDIQIIDPTQLPYEGRISASECAKWADRDACAFDQVKELVNAEKPDFIILTGDNVYGQFDGDGSNFIALVELMDSFGIPWSFINGNHDGETVVNYGGVDYTCGKGMQWQADYVKSNTENCLYDQGAETMGYGNFTVNLTENGKIVYTFVMMDTHGCDMPTGMTSEQIDWYESEIRKASKVRFGKGDLSAGVVPSFLFCHHPFRQHYLAMLKYSNTDRGFVTVDGSKLENGDYGANMEAVSYFQSNAMWERVQELGSTKGIFVGHSHCNNTSILYEGVRLTFGNKTGTYDSWYQQGGTRITIKDGTGEFVVDPIYTSGSKYGNR